jgi:Tfp pilus assembly PilM family ATPase
VSNRVHAFKDRDVQRLVKAARAAGLNPTAIEVDIKAARIKVFSGKSDDVGGDLDKWLEEHHRESPAQGR